MPSKMPSKYLQKFRCAVTYAVGILQNTFKHFAVLLRMQWGPLKIPSAISLCCYVCSGDPSKYLQKNRCAVTYAVGTRKNTFNGNQSRKIHANTAFRIPADYLQNPCRLPADYPVLREKRGYRYSAKSGLQNPCRLHAESLQITFRLPADYLQNPCRLPAESLRNPCRLPTDYLQNTCRLLREIREFRYLGKSGNSDLCLQKCLQNTFKKFAVLLRMLWGSFKIPSKNSLCCYVCSGDP